MIRFFASFALMLGALALLASSWPAVAQTGIFIGGSKKHEREQKENPDRRVFIDKGKKEREPSFFSRLYSRPQQKPKPEKVTLRDFRRPSGDTGLNIDKFYADYKQAANLDPVILSGSGSSPRTAGELRALTAYRHAPMVMQILENQALNEKYTAALMQKVVSPAPVKKPVAVTSSPVRDAKQKGSIFLDKGRSKKTGTTRKVFSKYQR